MLFKNSKGIFWIKSIGLLLEGTKITIISFYHHAFTLSEQWFDLQHTPDRRSATGFSKFTKSEYNSEMRRSKQW